MPAWIIAIVAIVIFAAIILLAYYYENIVIPAICFGAAILFVFVCIISGAYIMFIIPVASIVLGAIYMKDHTIHRKPPKEDKKWKEL